MFEEGSPEALSFFARIGAFQATSETSREEAFLPLFLDRDRPPFSLTMMILPVTDSDCFFHKEMSSSFPSLLEKEGMKASLLLLSR